MSFIFIAMNVMTVMEANGLYLWVPTSSDAYADMRELNTLFGE